MAAPGPASEPYGPASGFNEDQVRKALAKADIVTSSVYELLPEVVRENDPEGALKAFFGGVQAEYDRQKDSISDILMLIDPVGINNKFILEGSPTFFHTEQFLPLSGATSNTIVFNGSPPGVGGDHFYNGFGIFVWSDATTPDAVGQYRRVTNYVGATKTATVEPDWTVTPSGTDTIVALCWPDRIWLPTEVVSDPRRADGTVLPDQTSLPDSERTSKVILPSHAYISVSDDYYNGWQLEFLEGPNVGVRWYIADFVGQPPTVEIRGRFDEIPLRGQWFKLIPPAADQVSTTNNFYEDRWIRVISGTNDSTNNYRFKIQNRRIIKSVYNPLAVPASHVAYVADVTTGEGERWEFPPDPNNYFGVTNHFVSLAYLARQVGWELDSLDSEELQREQVRQAFNFYKLKGTKRAVELITRAFGLEATIQEQASNYVHPPDPVRVGGGSISGYNNRGRESCPPSHNQFPWGQVRQHLERGGGEDDVDCSLEANSETRDRARIPDSDIKLYVSRTSPSVFFDGGLLERIVDKVQDVLPIHVEIILVGFLQVGREKVQIAESIEMEGTQDILESVLVNEGFFVTPVGTVVVPLNVEGVSIETSLLVTTEARYDINFRYDGTPPALLTDPPNRGQTHYDVGQLFHQG